jgi:hypothetical protein
VDGALYSDGMPSFEVCLSSLEGYISGSAWGPPLQADMACTGKVRTGAPAPRGSSLITPWLRIAKERERRLPVANELEHGARHGPLAKELRTQD